MKVSEATRGQTILKVIVNHCKNLCKNRRLHRVSSGTVTSSELCQNTFTNSPLNPCTNSLTIYAVGWKILLHLFFSFMFIMKFLERIFTKTIHFLCYQRRKRSVGDYWKIKLGTDQFSFTWVFCSLLSGMVVVFASKSLRV